MEGKVAERSCHTKSAGEEGGRGGLSPCELQIELLACHQIAASHRAPYQWIKINAKIRESGFALKSTCGYQKALSSR